MEKNVIRYIIYAITIGVIYFVINRLNNRSIPSGNGHGRYAVTIPAAVKYVYFSLFLLGMMLFAVFLIFKMKGNTSIKSGNFCFALIISVIGLLVMILSTRWKIMVDSGQLVIYKMFNKAETVMIKDLDMAEIGSKSQLILSKDGKQLVVIDALCDNYSLLKEDLREYGKLP